MASEMGWGGMPLMRPSSLATRYQLYERDIIPERRIEPGQRYRARKNLAEHVSWSSSLLSCFWPLARGCIATQRLLDREPLPCYPEWSRGSVTNILKQSFTNSLFLLPKTIFCIPPCCV